MLKATSQSVACGRVLSQWLDAWLRLIGRHPILLPTLVGACLACTSLDVGFVLEDFTFLANLREQHYENPALDLYRFSAIDSDEQTRWMDQGILPWWTSPGLHMSFFRPLSASLIALDFALFDDMAVPYHVHSIVWFALTLIALGLVLQRVLSPVTAGLALLLFALDPLHAVSVSWMANRNAWVAAMPALLGFAAYLRWRIEGWRPGILLAPLGLATGLMGGEAALAVMGYFVAFEVWGRQEPPLRRLAALAPLLVVLCAWAAACVVADVGVSSGAGMYEDPFRHPGGWLAAALQRLLLLLSGISLHLPLDLWIWGPGWQMALSIGGLVGLALLAFLGWRLRGSMRDDEPSTLRWLLPGTAMSLVPALSAMPMGRLLLFPAIGSAVLIAILLLAWRRCFSARPWGVTLGILLMTFMHPGLALPGWVLQTNWLRASCERSIAVARDMEVVPDAIESQTVVVINLPGKDVAYDPFEVRRWLQLPVPRVVHLLTRTPNPIAVVRRDATTIDVEVQAGRFLDSISERSVRVSGPPLRTGHRIRVGAMEVRVLREDGKGPTRLRFVFDRSLDDPGYEVLNWDGRRLSKAW